MPYVRPGHSARRARRKLIAASAAAGVVLLVVGATLALLPSGAAERAIAAVTQR